VPVTFPQPKGRCGTTGRRLLMILKYTKANQTQADAEVYTLER
jgi:hypothetical protein